MKHKLIDVIKLSQQDCQHPIQCQLAYATKDNFLGRIVNGYHPDAPHICLMTRSAAEALCDVQNALNKKQLGLFVFDSYRPLRAVKDFKEWMSQPSNDEHELARKKIHYPNVEKTQLAALGYVCDDVSNHCFGDTIDLSLMDIRSGKLIDMGACFDYFDELSFPTTPVEKIGLEAHRNRLILTEAMQAAGYQPYDKEYWHFTYHKREVEMPLDIEITPELAGLGVVT